jgi:cytochrome P450
MTKYLLEHQKEVELSDDEIAYFSGGLFAAGVDTVSWAFLIWPPDD